MDRLKLFERRESIAAPLQRAALHQLLDAGDAYLEEFVEITRRDTQKPQALEQRHCRIEGLRQHTLVELQRRQFAIDEELWGDIHWFKDADVTMRTSVQHEIPPACVTQP